MTFDVAMTIFILVWLTLGEGLFVVCAILAILWHDEEEDNEHPEGD